MCEESVSQRLRQARISRGQSVEQAAARVGARIEAIHAIEHGRFHELPSGIYGRAIIRRHCAALGFDPEPVLALCGPLLRQLEDPIAGLARVRGLPAPRCAEPIAPSTPSSRRVSSGARDANAADDVPVPEWRPLAAAAIDALVVVGLLLAVVTCTVAAGVPVSAFGPGSAAAFTLMAILMGAAYFVVLGGVVGATLGEQIAGGSSEPRPNAPVDLRIITARALRCVTRDVVFIESCGAWIGRCVADRRWSVRGTDHVENAAG